jgi:hypothetical protein
MEPPVDLMDTYRKLADWHHQHGHPQQRDRFLVLAADAAHAEGHDDQAEALRIRLLRHNPHHLLKPYTSFAQALTADDVKSYVSDLRRSYPADTAAQLLASLPGQGGTSPERGGTVIPATQPVIDLDNQPKRKGPEPADAPAKRKAAESGDALKVYRVRDEPAPVARPGPDKERPLPAKVAGPLPPKPTPAAKVPRSVPPPPLPVHREVPPPAYSEPRLESEALVGQWICQGLAGIVLLGGLLLALLAFAYPFFAPR